MKEPTLLERTLANMAKGIVWTFIIGVIALMTVAAIQSHNTQYAAEDQLPTQVYDVISVSRYTHPVTNIYGGVKATEIRYTFVYVGADGALNTVEDFHPTDNGNEQIRRGKQDRYVIEHGGHQIYLELTEETLASLTGILS